MAILLTGGSGYIGSHVAVVLITAGYDVVMIDNLSNSGEDALDGIEKITGVRPPLYRADVSCEDDLKAPFCENHIEAVVHLAGFKAVGESVQIPLQYYRNNINSLLTLLSVMEQFSCNRIVFSSSATVYGMANQSPLTEDMPTGNCSNPYGWTKYFNEQILRDTVRAKPDVSAVILRYFNPVGAHPSGLIGEKPNGIPNNLMPRITQSAFGDGPPLQIFGNDYPTPDGTGIRDYIHVMDLAEGHLAALRYGETHSGFEVFNLGTGSGISVLNLLKTFQRVNDTNISYSVSSRRKGDVAVCYADATKAKSVLRWTAKRTVEEMCRDAWNWEKKVHGG